MVNKLNGTDTQNLPLQMHERENDFVSQTVIAPILRHSLVEKEREKKKNLLVKKFKTLIDIVSR